MNHISTLLCCRSGISVKQVVGQKTRMSHVDKQLELFDSLLENLRKYQANVLSKAEADDIDSSLELVTSLSVGVRFIESITEIP